MTLVANAPAGTWAGGGCARATFGPPSGTYRVDGFIVLVWHENLLSHLSTAAMHGPIQC